MAIRRPGPWMRSIDERILEHIHGEGTTTAALLADLRFFDTHRCVLADRLRTLSQAGYLQPVERGSDWYAITSGGVAYLRGRMRADMIWPAPSPGRPGHVLG